jgi:transposase-like protein
MEKNKQDAVGRRRPYDEAFKRDAVRLVAEEGYSFKAAALDSMWTVSGTGRSMMRSLT